jgi:hypothetical protein
MALGNIFEIQRNIYEKQPALCPEFLRDTRDFKKLAKRMSNKPVGRDR